MNNYGTIWNPYSPDSGHLGAKLLVHMCRYPGHHHQKDLGFALELQQPPSMLLLLGDWALVWRGGMPDTVGSHKQ